MCVRVLCVVLFDVSVCMSAALRGLTGYTSTLSNTGHVQSHFKAITLKMQGSGCDRELDVAICTGRKGPVLGALRIGRPCSAVPDNVNGQVLEQASKQAHPRRRV